jgi:Kef-type K+ transport system membrane component KefB
VDVGHVVLAVGALLAAGIGASLLAGRLRLPGLVLVLALGMAIGSDGLGWIDFDDFGAAQSAAVVALALILFEGGLSSGWSEIRPVLGVSAALATLGTLTFLNTWNDFLYPLVVTSSDEMRPLTVGLATLANQTGNAGFFMAGATVSFLPTFAFFLLMQRYVVRGVSLSGLKG